MIKLPSIKCWLSSIELFFVQIPVFYLPIFCLFVILSILQVEPFLSVAIFLLTLLSLSWLLFAYYYDWGKDLKKRYKFLPSKKGLAHGYYDTLIVLFSNLFAGSLKQAHHPAIYFVIWWIFAASFLHSWLKPTVKNR